MSIIQTMKRFIFVGILTIFLLHAFTEEAIFQLGGTYGWEKVSKLENITLEPGRFGLRAASLTSKHKTQDNGLDLYLSFDDQNIHNLKNYTVISTSFLPSGQANAKYGNNAAICTVQEQKSAVSLSPRHGSFFAGNEVLGSFTIEFWIKPEVTTAGATILEWNASLAKTGTIFYQHISARIMQNKIEWLFQDIWQKNKQGISVNLKSKSMLLPEKWSHHLITYNSENGLLEYRINGYIEAIEFLTDTRRENGEILFAELGRGTKVEFGKEFSGILDECIVNKSFSEIKNLSYTTEIFERLPLEGGRLESEIIDTGGNYSQAFYLEVDETKPEQTEIVYYLRYANEQFNWTESYPQWIEITPGCELKNFTARYFQIAAQLYPDGTCQASPMVHTIKLNYEKDSLPLPPNAVYAEGINGAVELTWTPSVDFDTQGYIIYYGERSGQYFYKESPIIVGQTLNYTVTGLENGRLYFFSVVAYDKAGPNYPGYFSKEVWARPTGAVDCPYKVQ